VRGLYLLTAKPVTYAANVAEADLADMGATNPHVKALRGKAAEEGREVVIVSAQVRAIMVGIRVRVKNSDTQLVDHQHRVPCG